MGELASARHRTPTPTPISTEAEQMIQQIIPRGYSAEHALHIHPRLLHLPGYGLVIEFLVVMHKTV